MVPIFTLNKGNAMNEPESVGVGGTEGSVEQRERRWYVNSYRQAAGRQGSAYAVEREADSDVWWVKVYLPNGEQRHLGHYDFETALRVQDYCVSRDTVTKLALIQLWEYGNSDPIEKLLTDAQTFGELPRRRVALTIEVHMDMRGTDEEIKNYVQQHMRTSPRCKAARVVDFNGPRIEEPRFKNDIV